jgi:hypothetical protein
MTRVRTMRLTLTYRPESCVLDAREDTLAELVRMCVPLKLLDLTATL